jgi:hypothetical protein
MLLLTSFFSAISHHLLVRVTYMALKYKILQVSRFYVFLELQVN